MSISKTPKRSGKKKKKGQFVKQSSVGGGSAGIQVSGGSSRVTLYFHKATAEEEARRHGLKSAELGVDKNSETHGQHSTSPPLPRTSALLLAAPV